MKWGVIIRSKNGNREYKKFKTKQEAEDYFSKATLLLEGYNVKIGLVSTVDPIPIDENKTKKRGQLWCPYCGEYKRFVIKEGYKRCGLCYVSTESFWVKKYNNLWR